MATQQHSHVLMFPWLAFGHMLPFLDLSKRLSAKGWSTTFVSTPRNIQRLSPTIPSNSGHLINLVQIPLPPSLGLLDGCEATVDLPLEHVQYLKKAYDGLQAPFERLLVDMMMKPPQVILFDFIPCWIPEISAKFGIPCAMFSVFCAATLAFLGPPEQLNSPCNRRINPEDFTIVPNWVNFPSTVAYPKFQAIQICKNINIPDISGKSSGERFATTLQGCDFVVVRGCKEFEGEYVDLLEQLYKKPVVLVGLLPPPIVERNSITMSTMWEHTFRWLDGQALRSVVFVGFGSEYKLTREQVHELALGLELSNLPFLWALKDPNDKLLLPSGFENRICTSGGRGLLCIGWAPQMEILGHQAIGGCLFHAGWGTIIESLSYGHTLILLPMMADQGLNATLLVHKGVGLQVERNEDGSFTKVAVAKAIKLAMIKQDGEPLRLEANKIKTIFANHQLHDNYVQEFVQYLNLNYKGN